MKKSNTYKPKIEYLDDSVVIDGWEFAVPSGLPDSIFSHQDIIDLWTEMVKVEFITETPSVRGEIIQNFIIDLDRICYRMKQTLELDLTSLPDEKERILRRLKHIIDELKKFDENPFLFGYLLGVSPDLLLDKFGYEPYNKIKQRISIWTDAPLNISEIIDYLNKLESGIKTAYKPIARAKSIDPFNFASTIACFYVAYFKKKPTKTKNGPFYNIVLTCYKAVGLRDKNPGGNEKVDAYNHVKAAVDGLRWSYPKFRKIQP